MVLVNEQVIIANDMRSPIRLTFSAAPDWLIAWYLCDYKVTAPS